MDNSGSRITLTFEDVRTQFPSIYSLKEMIYKKDSSDSELDERLFLMKLLIGSLYMALIVWLMRLEEESSTSFHSLKEFDGFMNTLSRFERFLKTPSYMTGGLPPIHHFASSLSALSGRDISGMD